MKNLPLLAKIIRMASLMRKDKSDPIKYTCDVCGANVAYKNGLVESRECEHADAGINATMKAKCTGSGFLKAKS